MLIVRAGAQAGDRFQLVDLVTHLGRHPDSEISLDDITVSRRHAEIERTPDGYVVSRCRVAQRHLREPGSHRPTAPLQHGDELQIGKFRLVFFERTDV